MTQQVKMLLAKSDNPISFPRPTRWGERIDSSKLFSGFHMSTVECLYAPEVSTQVSFVFVLSLE